MEQETENISLAGNIKVEEDLAHLPADQAEEVLVAAKDILQDLLPKFLFVKARYMSQKSDGKGGLIFLCAEKGVMDYLLFDAISESNRDWLRSIIVHRSPDIFQQLLKDYFREHNSSSSTFDCQKIRSDLLRTVTPLSLRFMFDNWDQPKLDILPVNGSAASDCIARQLAVVFENALSDLMMQRVSVEADYDFYTSAQFDVIRESFGLPGKVEEKPKKQEEEKEETEAPQSLEEKLKLIFKGRFIIDPVNGTPLQDIKVGDFAYCEITDRSEVAVSACRIIGAYKRGLWIPIRGVIMDIQEVFGDRCKYTLKLAPGIYVELQSFTGLRVQTRQMTPHDAVMKAKGSSESFLPIPILIAAILIGILVISLLAAK